jgi:hypothetical protein
VLINTSGKAIKALEFNIWPLNPFGEPVQRTDTGVECIVRISDKRVEPFLLDPSSFIPLTKEKWWRFASTHVQSGGKLDWPLNGFEEAAQAKVTLTRVLFADDSVWTNDQSSVVPCPRPSSGQSSPGAGPGQPGSGTSTGTTPGQPGPGTSSGAP